MNSGGNAAFPRGNGEAPNSMNPYPPGAGVLGQQGPCRFANPLGQHRAGGPPAHVQAPGVDPYLDMVSRQLSEDFRRCLTGCGPRKIVAAANAATAAFLKELMLAEADDTKEGERSIPIKDASSI